MIHVYAVVAQRPEEVAVLTNGMVVLDRNLDGVLDCGTTSCAAFCRMLLGRDGRGFDRALF